MPGAIAFTDAEIETIRDAAKYELLGVKSGKPTLGKRESRFAKRNRCFLEMQLCTGLRVAEMCHLHRSHVLEKDGRVRKHVHVEKKYMKGQYADRDVFLSDDCQAAVKAYVDDLKLELKDHHPFYISNKTRNKEKKVELDEKGEPKKKKKRKEDVIYELKPRSMVNYFHNMFLAVGLEYADEPGKRGTHCFRKTQAKQVYEDTGHNMNEVQKVLGHKSIASTYHYMPEVSMKQTETLMINAAENRKRRIEAAKDPNKAKKAKVDTATAKELMAMFQSLISAAT